MNMNSLDDHVLLSIINTKLRDYDLTLNDLCDDLAIQPQDLIDRMDAIGYQYDIKTNQFKSKTLS